LVFMRPPACLPVILRAAAAAVIGVQPQECGRVIVLAVAYATGTARRLGVAAAASCSSEL
jgi:alkylhydroperoxidase/carboxymuconolactone decarboxylase family protein YurZ